MRFADRQGRSGVARVDTFSLCSQSMSPSTKAVPVAICVGVRNAVLPSRPNCISAGSPAPVRPCQVRPKARREISAPFSLSRSVAAKVEGPFGKARLAQGIEDAVEVVTIAEVGIENALELDGR